MPVSPDVALRAVDIPLVIGTNTDEYRLWLTPEQLAGISALKLTLARLATGVPRRAVRRTAPRSRRVSRRDPRPDRDGPPAARARRACRRGAHRPTFYELAWPSPVRDLRAAHAIDIGFVFDRLEASDSQTVVGPDAPRELAARMHADWVGVVRTGEPGGLVTAPDAKSSCTTSHRASPRCAAPMLWIPSRIEVRTHEVRRARRRRPAGDRGG
jgi:para-nitrobenzyl esterase